MIDIEGFQIGVSKIFDAFASSCSRWTIFTSRLIFSEQTKFPGIDVL